MLASSSAVPARMTGLAEKAGGALEEAVAEGEEEVLREREDVLSPLARAEGVGMGVMTVAVPLGEMVGLRERVSVAHGVTSVTVALGEMEALKLTEVELLRETVRLVEELPLTEGEPEGPALRLPVRETLGVREAVMETLGEREMLPLTVRLPEGLSEGDCVGEPESEPESEALLDREGLPEPVRVTVLLWQCKGELLRVNVGLALPEGQKEAEGEGEGVSRGDSVAPRVPERVGEGLAQGVGVSVAHWLAVALSVPGCVSVAHWLPDALSVPDGVCVAHCEGGALRVGLGLGLRLTVREAEGVRVSGKR